MSKLYKAGDALDGNEDTLFLINENGVLVYERTDDSGDEIEIVAAKIMEEVTPRFLYLEEDRMKDMINPVLLAEW